jgi:hypothetical protein
LFIWRSKLADTAGTVDPPGRAGNRRGDLSIRRAGRFYRAYGFTELDTGRGALAYALAI